jgi:translocation protein SEC62
VVRKKTGNNIGQQAAQFVKSATFKAKFGKIELNNASQLDNLFTQLLDAGFFVRSVKSESGGLEPDVSRDWSDSAHYVWVYQGSQIKSLLGALGLLIVAFTFVMFPLWPSTLRTGVWYLGVAGFGFIGFIMFLGVVRLILFAITIFAAPPGIWLFPNLFEDVGFFESFVPLYEWHKPSQSAAQIKKTQ